MGGGTEVKFYESLLLVLTPSFRILSINYESIMGKFGSPVVRWLTDTCIFLFQVNHFFFGCLITGPKTFQESYCEI